MKRRKNKVSFFKIPGAVIAIIIVLGLLLFSEKIASTLDEPIVSTVNPQTQTIVEEKTLSVSSLKRFVKGVAESIASVAYLGNLADPRVKYVRISPGMRKEQIAFEFKSRLNWNEKEEAAFFSTAYDTDGLSREGYFYPGVYIVPTYKGGEEVGELLLDRFDREVTLRISSSTKKVLNMDTIVTIASIIEREAAGKHDMNLISGIIWNRLWAGMKLDIDSTLQYAKGNEENGWWPRVVPADKYIESPYNTYQYEGLPPTAISSPSFAAISAALKPKKTNCLFFIHDDYRRIHCAKTYEEHKKNIARYL